MKIAWIGSKLSIVAVNLKFTFSGEWCGALKYILRITDRKAKKVG